MLVRLTQALLSVLLFPLLHLGYILLISIHQRLPLYEGFSRFSGEILVLAYTPFAVLTGRYPSFLDIYFNPRYVVLMIFSIFVIWSIASRLLVWGIRQLLPHFTAIRRQYTWGTSGLLLIMLAIWLGIPYLPTPTTAEVTVDYAYVIEPMPLHAHNFSQGGESQMKEPGYFENAMASLYSLTLYLVRIDHLYDYYDVYRIQENGKPAYNWIELDRVVDAIIAQGASPLMTFSYCPPELARTNVYGPPTDLDRWEELVYQTVYHLNVERQLDIQYWEVWNEPNLQPFWDGTLDEYLELYHATARGALRADSTIKLGGPATSSMETGGLALLYFFEREWIIQLVDYAQRHNLPLDFISWHLYEANPDYYTRSIEHHHDWVSDFDPPPQLLLTEWNWTGKSFSKHDTGETVAFVAAVLQRFADSEIDYAFFFEPIDGNLDWRGDWGLMRSDGSPKPIYYGFQLLSQLQGNRLRVTNNHKHVSALATRRENRVSILLGHYMSGHQSITVNLTITNLDEESVPIVDIYGVDDQHGNPYFGNEDLLVETTALQKTTSGTWQLSLEVPTNGIRLIQFQVTTQAN